MPIRDQRVCSQSTTWPSLVCDAEQRAKKAPRRIEALFANCVGSFLDYFPFLAAAFLSAFFIFFAIVISFSHLLSKTVLVGLRQNLQSHPLLFFYGCAAPLSRKILNI
jgi:hypothetical protein